MALLPILKFPDPRLHKVAQPVSQVDDRVRRLIDEARVGFAPGSTFGPGGEGALRMCYLKDLGPLEEALGRFVDWMKTGRVV